MRILRALLFAMFLPQNAFAIDEVNYLNAYKKDVMPFYKSGTSHNFKAFDETRIHYHYINQNSKKAIFILTGRTEPTSKYAEVVYDLKLLGYDFYLMDTRGQGHSDHLLNDKHKGYVSKYQDYLKDIDQLFENVIKPKSYDEVVFLGHSMGGAIGLRYAQTRPNAFQKIMVSTPMLELLLDGKNESVVLAYMKLMKLIGKGKNYISGGGAYSSFNHSFESNRVTHSPSRHVMARNLELNDESLKMGSATNNWVIEAIKLGRKTFKKREKLHHIPMLLFQAGIEHFSRDKRQRELCVEHPKCQLFVYPEAKHEMLQEKDSIRNQVLDEIRLFLGN